MSERSASENESLGRKNRRDTLLVIIAVAVLVALVFIAVKLFDPGYSRDPFRREEYVLDDYVTITAYGKNRSRVEEAVAAAFDELYRVQAVADRYNPDGELYGVNATAAAGPVAVSDDLWELIATGREIYDASGGLFDITVGPLVDVWDVVGRRGRGDPPPRDEEIKEALRKVGMDKLVLDASNHTVYFSLPGMVLDVGGLAKGYALDRAAEALRSRGIESAIIDMISSTLFLGDKPAAKGGPLWSVEVSNPRGEDPIAAFTVGGGIYISTSGDYQRFFEYEGVRYHHILDPRTGYPAQGTMAATVIGGRDGAWSDAMSTAAFIMGYPAGADWVREQGAEAMMVDAGGAVHTTPGMEQWLVGMAERVE